MKALLERENPSSRQENAASGVSPAVRDVSDLPLLLTMEETAKVLRIGLNSAYSAVREGRIRSVKLNRRILVPRQAIIELLAG